MLYSLSSISASSTSTSGSDSDDMEEEEPRELASSTRNTELAAHRHTKSHSTSSSPIKSREYDADNDLMMHSMRSLRGFPLKNSTAAFDMNFDPFNSSNATTELRAPATADSTRSLKRVTWASHSHTAGGTSESHDKKHKKKTKSTHGANSSKKSSLKRSPFHRFSHFQNWSQPDLTQRPPSSLYSMTPDVTHDHSALHQHTNDSTGGGHVPRHPYDQDLSTDKHFNRFDPAQTSSTLDLPTRKDLAPPETLSSLFSADLNDDFGENGFPTSAPTTVSAGFGGKEEQRVPLNLAPENTITALSSKFDNLSIDSQRQRSQAKPDVVMKDASIRFSLRPLQEDGDAHIMDHQGISVQHDSVDGSFEDILDRKPPELPELSRVAFENNVAVKSGHSGGDYISAQEQRHSSPISTTDLLFHNVLDPGIHRLRPKQQQHQQRQQQQAELLPTSPQQGSQAMFIVNQRLSRVVALLGKLSDLPLSEFTGLGSEVPIGEKVGLLEKTVARLSTKIEDKSVMRMVYEGKISQLTALVESLSQENSDVKSDGRQWRQKYETESDEFDTALKRLLRIADNTRIAETNMVRDQKVERLLSCVKAMLLQREKLEEVSDKLRKKTFELEEVKDSIPGYQLLQEQFEGKQLELAQTKQVLERHKEMLASLETEHRKLQLSNDKFVLANQSQTEDLHHWEDKWSQTAQQLRDQTTVLCEAEKQLEVQTGAIQKLEHQLEIKEKAIEELSLEVSYLGENKSVNDKLQSEVIELRAKLQEIQELQAEISDLRGKVLENAFLSNEVEELRSTRKSQEEQIQNFMTTLEEHQLLFDKFQSDSESLARQQKRLLYTKEEELKRLQLLLLDANDVANEYSQQLSFHRDRLSDTIQKYNQLGRSLDDINDQNRELRSSLLKSGAQRDDLKRAFHALEVSCVRCLDGVIQEDSLEGIKQGLNSFALLDEFSSRDLVILEDSASFLNEALALLSKEYRVLLKRAESEQMIPLRKQKRSSTKKTVAIDQGDVLKELKDNDSVLSASKYVAPSRPMTRNSRVMRRQIDDDIVTTRDTMRYNIWNQGHVDDKYDK